MTHKIAVLAGDGIGPEVCEWAQRSLELIARGFNHEFEFSAALLGHAAIQASGEALPATTLNRCRAADAILLGAVGDPSYDNNPTATVRPEQGLLALRSALGLYCNLRPIRIFDELLHASSLKPECLQGADILFFRELTGGIYFGEHQQSADGQTASDLMVYTKAEVERIAHQAFKAAQRRQRKVHSVDKANVLAASRLWRATVNEVAQAYPQVEVIHQYVDNAAMQLIRQPKQFDVVLTGNMFGDNLTDAASQITGSLGMLPSASIGDRWGMYEPIHGSAPAIAGRNIATPLATILSAAMLLEFSFDMKEESEVLIGSVEEVLQQGYRTADIASPDTAIEQILSTSEMGGKVLEVLESKLFQSVVI